MKPVERISMGIGALALAGIVGMGAWNAVSDPLESRREYLQAELANIPTIQPGDVAEPWPFSEWQAALDEKPGLWRELIAPPPQAAPAAAAPRPPDLREKLDGVRASTSMVGDKVLILVPGGNPRGSLFGVGETIRGVTLKEIGDNDVTFSLFWEQGNREIIFKIPRERRFN